MGLTGNEDLIPFTKKHVLDKNLVINMLKYEESFTKSDKGQNMYRNTLNNPLVSLTVEKTINRIVLQKFGFDTSDNSVSNYRTIFKTYFKSPNNYDKDVIESVHYMRENKCVFYTAPVLKIGDIIPNCGLFELDGETKTTLFDTIRKENANHTVIAAFSLS